MSDSWRPLWTVARQAPLPVGFSRQEYWSGLPCSPPGDLPNPGIKPISLSSLAPASGSLPLTSLGKPLLHQFSFNAGASCSHWFWLWVSLLPFVLFLLKASMWMQTSQKDKHFSLKLMERLSRHFCDKDCILYSLSFGTVLAGEKLW